MFIKSQDGKRIFPMTFVLEKYRRPAPEMSIWEWGSKKCVYVYTIEANNYTLGQYRTIEQRDEVWEDILNWLEYQYEPIFNMPKSLDRDKEQ